MFDGQSLTQLCRTWLNSRAVPSSILVRSVGALVEVLDLATAILDLPRPEKPAVSGLALCRELGDLDEVVWSSVSVRGL